MRWIIVPLALILGACSPQAPAGNSAAADSGSVYSQGPASRGGTGKYYMGREIAWTMSHLGASWLDREDREAEERTDLLLNALPFGPDSHIADIGAGSGYFTLPIAAELGEGRVYAVDIQPEMLDIIAAKAARDGLEESIELVLAKERSPALPEDRIDLAFMVDAYHEFAWPREVMTDLYGSMRPGGKVVLIEYRAEDPSIPIIPVHKMTADQVILELTAIGFEFVENRDLLPQQHFLVFRRPAEG